VSSHLVDPVFPADQSSFRASLSGIMTMHLSVQTTLLFGGVCSGPGVLNAAMSGDHCGLLKVAINRH
jgi:hypothetical protein